MGGLIVVGMIAVLMAAPLAAQEASSAAGLKHSSASGRLDVAFTYNPTLSNITSGSSFWMQGAAWRWRAASIAAWELSQT